MSVQTTTRPINGLASIADSDGVFSIVAMDQRNTLRRMFAAVNIEPTESDMFEAKISITEFLSKSASGILLDPQYGVTAINKSNVLAPTCGLLVAAENPDRGDFNGEPRPSRLASQNAAWVKNMGGQAVKYLVMMHPGRPFGAGEPNITEETLEIVRQVVQDCRGQGIPSVIENLIYQLPGREPLTDQARENLIVESALLLAELKPDLLKLEFPVTAKGCQRISNSINIPWAVLSAGVPFEKFKNALRMSCDEGGASGFIAGRSVWKEAIGMNPIERKTFMEQVALPRLDVLIQATSGRATPWTAVRARS
jgi:tagatose-1,6-bisphosphate aldolase